MLQMPQGFQQHAGPHLAWGHSPPPEHRLEIAQRHSISTRKDRQDQIVQLPTGTLVLLLCRGLLWHEGVRWRTEEVQLETADGCSPLHTTAFDNGDPFPVTL